LRHALRSRQEEDMRYRIAGIEIDPTLKLGHHDCASTRMVI
jgi:hypothetical protein